MDKEVFQAEVQALEGKRRAAPEMYEALEMAEKYIVNLYRCNAPSANFGVSNRFAESDEMLKKIRAALKAATTL